MQKNNDNVKTLKKSQSFYYKNRSLRYENIIKNKNDYNDIMQMNLKKNLSREIINKFSIKMKRLKIYNYHI